MHFPICTLQVPSYIQCQLHNLETYVRSLRRKEDIESRLLPQQETLHFFEKAMNRQHDEEKVVDIGFKNQLKMVIIVCEEICARANKVMSKMDYTRESRRFVPFIVRLTKI